MSVQCTLGEEKARVQHFQYAVKHAALIKLIYVNELINIYGHKLSALICD
jgi:hypothetical protein